jgi:hypothetical protein
MIQQFYSNQQNIASTLLLQVTASLRKYNDRDIDAAIALHTTLDACITAYSKINKTEKESRFESLKSELTTALRGVNPYTLEKVKLHRNEMIKNTAFRILQSSEEIIRTELEGITDRLKQAEELISQIILAAIQGNLIAKDDIKKITTQTAIEKLWKDIGNDAGLNIAVKKVQLMVSQPDITILLAQILETLK